MNDLALALVVARVAVKNEIPFKTATDLLSHTLGKQLKQKKQCKFAAPSIRQTRSKLQIFPVILKIKGLCKYRCCPKTVQSLVQYKLLLSNAPWTVCHQRRALYVCHLLECLLFAFSGEYENGPHLNQTKDVLLDMMCLVMSRCDERHPEMTECLLVVFAQLVFFFRYPDGANNRLFPLFCSAVGLVTKRTLSNFAIPKTTVVLTSEILVFQMELVHLYCTKYDSSSLVSAKGILSAGLAIHEEPDLIEHLDSLLW